MNGKIITHVKIFGLCSKHRKDEDILKDNNGRTYTDAEISCVRCSL